MPIFVATKQRDALNYLNRGDENKMKRALYIPGLGHENMDLSVKAYAQRMMKAIDETAANKNKKYRVETAEREYDSDGSVTSVVSLFENDGKAEKEIYRFYEFRYGKFLTARFNESNVLYKFVSLLFVLVTRFVSVAKSLSSLNDGINYKSKAQAIYFAALYILLALYLVTLIPALLAIVASFAEGVEKLKFLVEPIKNYDTALKAILASFSAVMLLSPNSKTILSTMATEYLSADQYLSVGEQRLLIMGKLTRLIEVIAEEDASELELEIHSYSFGTVLALDVIFPYESEANTRIQKNVTRLITIGCPFDFIEIYWKDYFSDRQVAQLSLKSWHNINSDLDVLSTQFSGTSAKRSKFISSDEFWSRLDVVDIKYNLVNPKLISFLQMLMFYGLRAHQMYWDKNVDSKNCLFKIAQAFSGETDGIAESGTPKDAALPS